VQPIGRKELMALTEKAGAASLRAGKMRSSRSSVGAGAVAPMATVWLLLGSRDLSVAMNATLGGLVAIVSRCVLVRGAAALMGAGFRGSCLFLKCASWIEMGLDDPGGVVGAEATMGMAKEKISMKLVIA